MAAAATNCVSERFEDQTLRLYSGFRQLCVPLEAVVATKEELALVEEIGAGVDELMGGEEAGRSVIEAMIDSGELEI